MEKTTDIVSYSEIIEIIHKKRFALAVLFVGNVLISTLLIFFVPVNYKALGAYSMPLRGYFKVTGDWAEQPYTELDSFIMKINRTNVQVSEDCKSDIVFLNTSFELGRIDDNKFQIVTIGNSYYCAKSMFEKIHYLVSQDLTSIEMKKKEIQNALIKGISRDHKSNYFKENLITTNLANSNSATIPFSEFFPMSVVRVNNDWVKIYKYGFIFQFIISALLILYSIGLKPTKG